MNCNICSKFFCRNRGVGCDEGISYVEAKILHEPKRIEIPEEPYNGITMEEAAKALNRFAKFLMKEY